jgi:hypothetical protein
MRNYIKTNQTRKEVRPTTKRVAPTRKISSDGFSRQNIKTKSVAQANKQKKKTLNKILFIKIKR